MTTRQDKRQEWLSWLQEVSKQADSSVPKVELISAVIGLVSATALDALDPKLQVQHAECRSNVISLVNEQRHPVAENDSAIDAVLAFLNAKDLDTRRNILKENQKRLLSDAADEVLAHLIEQ